MGERCETCRFGNVKRYVEPAPLAPEKPAHWLFGRSRWASLQRRWDVSIHAEQSRQAREDVPCMRWPEIRRVSKQHWCGEYQEKPNAQ